MELHEDEEEEEKGGRRGKVVDGVVRPVARRGPIIMVRDPITNYPMLTNLPGAPGMVHWYDPRSASVIGTLEVRVEMHPHRTQSVLCFSCPKNSRLNVFAPPDSLVVFAYSSTWRVFRDRWPPSTA